MGSTGCAKSSHPLWRPHDHRRRPFRFGGLCRSVTGRTRLRAVGLHEPPTASSGSAVYAVRLPATATLTWVSGSVAGQPQMAGEGSVLSGAAPGGDLDSAAVGGELVAADPVGVAQGSGGGEVLVGGGREVDPVWWTLTRTGVFARLWMLGSRVDPSRFPAKANAIKKTLQRHEAPVGDRARIIAALLLALAQDDNLRIHAAPTALTRETKGLIAAFSPHYDQGRQLAGRWGRRRIR